MRTTKTRFFMRSILLAGIVLASTTATAEDLDLTRIKLFDWSLKEFGHVRGAHALLAPSADPKTVAEETRKQFGIRLSTEDVAHTIVLSAGIQSQGTRLILQRATIDRFRHLVELEVLIEKPSAKNAPPKKANGKAKEKEAAVDEEFVIGPARPELPKKRSKPLASSS